MESNVPDKVRSSKHKEKCFSYGSCAWICQFSSQKIFQKFFDWNFSFCIVSHSLSTPDLYYIFVTNRLVVLEIVAILCNIFIYHNFCNNAPI
jgi:hypothetical protein